VTEAVVIHPLYGGGREQGAGSRGQGAGKKS